MVENRKHGRDFIQAFSIKMVGLTKPCIITGAYYFFFHNKGMNNIYVKHYDFAIGINTVISRLCPRNKYYLLRNVSLKQ